MPLPLSFYPFPMLLGMGILLVILIIFVRKNRGLRYILHVTTFWFYLLAVISMTIFPIPFLRSAAERTPASIILSRVNLIPLNFGRLFDLYPILAVKELGGNILLTIPLGFGLPFIVSFKACSLPWIALGFGVAIELSQLAISLIIGGSYRSIDINDVHLNTLGVLMGYGFFRGLLFKIPTLLNLQQ